MSPPVVVAKGFGTSAKHIRRVAAEAGFPAIKRKSLARALHRRVDSNQSIPADQYVAVAEVLANVERSPQRTELQSPGTGPFFGEKTHFAGKRSPENMDLSPSLRTLQFSCPR